MSAHLYYAVSSRMTADRIIASSLVQTVSQSNLRTVVMTAVSSLRRTRQTNLREYKLRLFVGDGII